MSDPRAVAGRGSGEERTGVDRLGVVLRPVRGGNGFEEALERVLQVLRLGLIPPGERLPPERRLAERLGVSRATVREVLRVLQDEGLLEARRGRYGGTFVRGPAGRGGGRGGVGVRGPASGAAGRPVGGLGTRPSARAVAARRQAPERAARAVASVGAAEAVEAVEAVEDTLRLREVLDVGAAGLCAADALRPADAERLRAALAATRQAEATAYWRADTLFHLTLAELSGSPSLATQYAAVRARLNELLDGVPLLVADLERAQAQHAALVEAVLGGDASRARAVMREHCAATAALLRARPTTGA
ncbi:FadR/GntR family transcriptional regulator [Streptomyces sp. 4N509B]|uniref:FadR/GntR family transcriptional regulator n=1 Tax=Streptomyces sp. 4N509B TaxID=3457413 RepID=UPI003FD33DC2